MQDNEDEDDNVDEEQKDSSYRANGDGIENSFSAHFPNEQDANMQDNEGTLDIPNNNNSNINRNN